MITDRGLINGDGRRDAVLAHRAKLRRGYAAVATAPATTARSTNLIEREFELGQIDRALAAATAGAGGLVIVEGPSGIGKTALLDATRERAAEAGVAVLAAVGSELESAFPYGIVRQLFEPVIAAVPDQRRERLLAGAGSLASRVVSPEPAGVEVERTGAVVHGLHSLTANIAAEEPVALLIDELQWADAPTLRFLAYLAQRIDGLRATVIVSIAAGHSQAADPLVQELRGSASSHLHPSPLTEGGVAALLAADLGEPVDPPFALACRDATGGNPLFVRELAAAVRVDGVSPTAAAAPLIPAVAPLTIAHITLYGLRRLSDDAVALARSIAVLGGDAQLRYASALADLDPPRAELALDALVGAELIDPAQGLRFRHPIVGEAIYRELAPGARSSAHRKAAAMLDSEGARIDAVAAHLLRCEPAGADDVVCTLRDAAGNSASLGEPDSALRYLKRALDEGTDRNTRADLLIELGDAEFLASSSDAEERFATAATLSDDPATRSLALIEQARTLLRSSDSERCLILIDRAIAELPPDERVLRLRAEALRATVAISDPSRIDAFTDGLETLRMLAAEGEVEARRPLLLPLIAWDARHDGQRDAVLARLDRAWGDGVYLTEGHSPELLGHAITSLVRYDELDRAQELLGAVRRHACATGSQRERAFASTHETLLGAQLGDLNAAGAALDATVERATEVELPIVLAYGIDVILERTDAHAALVETVDAAPLRSTEDGAAVLEARGRVRFAAGRREQAIEDLRRAGAIYDALGVHGRVGGQPWRSTLALMLDERDRDEALALATTALDVARRSGQPRAIGVTLLALGLLDQDVETLEQAVAVLAESSAKLDHARALVELGAARRRQRQRAAAREPLSRGLEMATRCGAERLAERARTELAATGARPRRDYITGRDALTATELRVAQMAADGQASKEIAKQLFVTVRTVDSHLNRVYGKLGVNSRKQLRPALTPR